MGDQCSFSYLRAFLRWFINIAVISVWFRTFWSRFGALNLFVNDILVSSDEELRDGS